MGDLTKTLLHPVVSRPLMLEIPNGSVGKHSSVNKFGRTTNADTGVATDIWDRANATQDQDVWVAPTVARVHNVVSADANDTSAGAGGTGARTMRVFGLTSWTAAEVSEDISLLGATPVATANAYVIIHRMRMLTWGTAGPNVGLITATAVTDASVTAQVNAMEGQTQMAIYGWPSTKVAYVTGYYASVLKSGGAAAVDMSLRLNPIPDSQVAKFIVKHTLGLQTTGTSKWRHIFEPYVRFAGPAILKVQAVSSALNVDVSAGFDLILVDA